MSEKPPLPRPWGWRKRFSFKINGNNLLQAFEIFDGFKRVRYEFRYDSEGNLIDVEKLERIE